MRKILATTALMFVAASCSSPNEINRPAQSADTSGPVKSDYSSNDFQDLLKRDGIAKPDEMYSRRYEVCVTVGGWSWLARTWQERDGLFVAGIKNSDKNQYPNNLPVNDQRICNELYKVSVADYDMFAIAMLGEFGKTGEFGETGFDYFALNSDRRIQEGGRGIAPEHIKMYHDVINDIARAMVEHRKQ